MGYGVNVGWYVCMLHHDVKKLYLMFKESIQSIRQAKSYLSAQLEKKLSFIFKIVLRLNNER